MKKNLLYLFTVLCTLSFFTACSDDDDDKSDDGWKAVSATYKAETLILNGTEGKASSTETVKVDATSAEAASVTLGNVVVGEPEVKVDAKLTKAADDSYTLTGENSNSDRVVSIQGTVKSGKLTITASVKITSPVVGAWSLTIANGMADVFANIEPTSEASAMISGMVKQQLGALIAQKVESVTVTYGEDGKLGIAFKTTAAGNSSVAGIIGLLDPRYYVKDGQLYLAINKSIMTMGETMMGAEMAAAIKSLLVENGEYYALPINMKVENNSAQFYVSKDIITKVLPVVIPLLPAEVAPYIQMVTPVIESATVVDFGLGFTK